jgi:flagellar export protein FliJ
VAFRFRAQAALDLRDRELQEAQRELAQRQGDRDAAGLRVTQAEQALIDARVSASEAQRTVTDCTTLQWYRFWIVRLDHERKAHAAALATREDAVTEARAACLRAQQKHDSLERFRDKARRGYEAAEAETERKLFDELATRRYAVTRQSVGVLDS